jgi:PAS domain S-box-containing protein
MAGATAGAPSCHSNRYTSGSTQTTQGKWPQYVVNGIPDFLHVFDTDGRIRYASPTCKHLTGYEPTDLLGRSIIDLVHPDDSDLFLKEIYYSKKRNKSVRFFYRFQAADSRWVIFESQVQWHSGNVPDWDPLLQGDVETPAFFVMARPYQTKSTTLLDSFLEHKIEHERLKKRVEELKREEEEELAAEEEEELKLSQEHETANDVWLRDHERRKRIKLKQPGLAGRMYPKSCKLPKKNKTMRGMSRDHICTICGSTESPEWRRGPEGPQTLCNACGRK